MLEGVVSRNTFPEKRGLKGGYLDFSHLPELKNIYIYHRNLFEKRIQIINNKES